MLDISKLAKDHNLSVDELVFYSLSKASEITGINRNTLALWAKSGLPFIQDGSGRPKYVRLEDVNSFVSKPVGRRKKSSSNDKP